MEELDEVLRVWDVEEEVRFVVRGRTMPADGGVVREGKRE